MVGEEDLDKLQDLSIRLEDIDLKASILPLRFLTNLENYLCMTQLRRESVVRVTMKKMNSKRGSKIKS